MTKSNQWLMNRAGLLNFWYYDEEIFQFEDGKLLLRGTNGSGKSVTMQSFIPVLLDGKKTPDRLDPFGSKARRMEDYLLGEKEVVNRDERTGYLFIEYKKYGVEQYITTGIGMQARRNKPMKSWYFLITDNRRIGVDFELAHKTKNETIPFSAKELENRLESGGHLVHTQAEYMELVNKYIFGFESTDAYEDLIKLLIQLRSPKLSKDFKPTVIYEILESALPPLTDDELRHLSESIENMDQTQQQLEQLEREYDANAKLLQQYDIYNQFILAERAEKYERARQKYKEVTSKSVQLTTELDQLQVEIEELQQKEQKYKIDLDVLSKEKESLQSHQVWRLQEDLTQKQKDLQRANEQFSKMQGQFDSLENKRFSTVGEEKDYHDQIFRVKEQLKQQLQQMGDDAEQAAFAQHDMNKNDWLKQDKQEFDFSLWKREVRSHIELLRNLEKHIFQQQHLQQQYKQLEKQSSEKLSEVDALQKQYEQYERWFSEEQQKLEERIFQWVDKHEFFAYSPEQRQQIARLVQGLYEQNHFAAVREQLDIAIRTYQAEIDTSIRWMKQLITDKEQQIQSESEKLQQLTSQKMIEPERSASTENFRQELEEQGITYIPFYEAVEFQQHVTEQQKERIESALAKLGILDSLITNRPLNIQHDAMITPNPQLLGYTLADFLKPDLEKSSEISSVIIDEVLRSIPMNSDGGTFAIDEQGFYMIGCLVGHAPAEETSKFIGRTSRKRHHQLQLVMLQEKISMLEAELKALLLQRQQQQQQIIAIQQAIEEIPTDRGLLDIEEEMVKLRLELKAQKNVLQQIDTEWNKVRNELSNLQQIIREMSRPLDIVLTAEAISQAVTAMDYYSSELGQFIVNYEKAQHIRVRMRDVRLRLEDLEERLEILRDEQFDHQKLRESLVAMCQSIEQQLQLEGIEEIQQRIQFVQGQLEELTRGLEEVRKALPKSETALETVKQSLKNIEIEIQFWMEMTKQWQKAFEAELSLGFIELENKDARNVISTLKPVLQKFERHKVQEQLTRLFLSKQADLMEFRMQDYTKDIKKLPTLQKFEGETFAIYINEFEQFCSRRLIQMEYQGQRVSPYFIHKALGEELAEQRNWLDEQDRELYEDIIVNSVGTILRRRIQRAEQWVKEMDQIMASRDNSSGLIFSISWKPLTAEAEAELDTRELIQLLQRNSKFLQEDDLNKITRHFRSRIERAKELIGLRNEGAVLHQVLKEVLDYRKWFTFVLSFSRVNEPKRELTNNAFFRFSGGEKAMAMYIPLFTAAYSRYKEASEMAPFIISLDEAFAGVDEQNIRDMFEVVEKLGFNYIMNSQALWGDYDTVPSLAIAEIVRPKNADFVTVIRFIWNGKQRILNK